MLEARQGAAYTGENMTSPESPAILYEHADGRRAVVSANRVATFAIDNPDWHRAGPVEIVWVDETAPAWRPIETAPKDGTLIVLGARNGVWLGKYLPLYGSGYRPENPWSSMLLNHDHMAERYTRPTHWMPLPPSPSSADEGGRNG